MNKIDVFNKKYNQIKYVEDLLNSPCKFESHKTYLSDLRLIGIYLRDVKQLKPKEREAFLEEYCKHHCSEYNEVLWINILKRANGYSKRKEQKLKNIKYPIVYKHEFEYIDQLDIEERYKKILFTLLIFYKFEQNRCDYDKDNYYIPNFVLNPSKVGKYSGIKLKKDEHIGQLNGELRKMGYVDYSNKNDGQLIATFIKDIPNFATEKELQVEIVNIENAYLYYDYFVNSKKISFCKKCGDIFKKVTNNQLYCKQCRKEEDVVARHIVCCDCGKEFEISPLNKRTCRCSECQKEHIRIYDRERKRNKSVL